MWPNHPTGNMPPSKIERCGGGSTTSEMGKGGGRTNPIACRGASTTPEKGKEVAKPPKGSGSGWENENGVAKPTPS